jgi:hypothetical protein
MATFLFQARPAKFVLLLGNDAGKIESFQKSCVNHPLFKKQVFYPTIDTRLTYY